MTDDVSLRSRVTRAAAARARILVPLVLVGAAVVAGLWWHYSGRESTDDAQLDGHITQIAARVGGTVLRVAVQDNQAGARPAPCSSRSIRATTRWPSTRAEAELAATRSVGRGRDSDVPIASHQTLSRGSDLARRAASSSAQADRRDRGTRDRGGARAARLRARRSPAAQGRGDAHGAATSSG